MENPAFKAIPEDQYGEIFNDTDHDKFPITVANKSEDDYYILSEQNMSFFVYVYSGKVDILSASRKAMPLTEGMYASFSTANESFSLSTGGKCLVVGVHHSEGLYYEVGAEAMFSVGGPIERKGRLRYIDGCTDSLLIPPVIKGGPCLNHLHFPAGIVQTPHTHPSHRIGMVVRGEGVCVTPFGNLDLKPGTLFIIKEDDGAMSEGEDGDKHRAGTHSFNTYGSPMDVIAFHPDSDFGPEHENHPMINRTMVDGVSASDIDEIKTNQG